MLQNTPRKESNDINFYYKWLEQRQLGEKFKRGTQDKFFKKFYSRINENNNKLNYETSTRDQIKHHEDKSNGGIFNLEFSDDGSLLVAACEKKSIALYDPFNQKRIELIERAHDGCVNCIKFLDSNVFASCSDDTTVALWDVRNLKIKLRTLLGHSNWVKNIEYSPADRLLITSSFDGNVFGWDLNNYTENGLIHNQLFHTSCLMRTRLSQDCKKMVMCTTSGYMIIIHNLNLRTIAEDLQEFKPNVYRLLQMSREPLPISASMNHLFSTKRKLNRIELITDFPKENDAEIISSLQIHPYGWSCLSRNISVEEESEWTCVHDLQEKPHDEVKQLEKINRKYEMEIQRIEKEIKRLRERERNLRMADDNQSDREHAPGLSFFRLFERSPVRFLPRSSENANQSREPLLARNDLWEAMVAISEGNVRQFQTRENAPSQRIRQLTSGIENDENEEQEDSDSLRNEEESDRHATLRRSTRRKRPRSCTTAPDTGGASTSSRNRSLPLTNPLMTGARGAARRSQEHMTMYKNHSRLTHYISELNVGKGFIKELCFSPDGRVICSPFGFGIRLLAFSENCQELTYCEPTDKHGVKLHEISTNMCHKDIVVSTKFSPKHQILVSGCLKGKIVWHQPIL